MNRTEKKETRLRNWKNTKFASMAWILAILIVIIAVILNMIVAKLDFTWDISPNKMYSLTDTTEEYLDEMDVEGDSVDMYLLCKMDELSEDTETMTLYRCLQAYDAHDCINLIDIDPEEDDETMEQLNGDNAYSLSTGDIILINGDIERRVPGSSMYYDEEDEDGNVTYEEFQGENLITGSLKAVVTGYTPTVYFLTGHGEKDISEYGTFCNNLTNYNYNSETLDLSQTEEIPDDTALILVAAPTSDLSDEEYDIIDSYLQEGGNISLLMSPCSKELAFTNFEAVMSNFGIAMDYDTVYETNSDYHVSGDNTTVMCELNELDEDSEAADLTSSLIDQGLYTYMPQSRSFTYNTDGGTFTVEPLITTYDTAVGDPYGGTSDDPDEVSGALTLALYSESPRYNNAKCVAFGNAEFLDDEHLTSETVIVPVYLYLSTISWMYDSDVDMEIEAKTTDSDYIDLGTESFATKLIVVFTILPIAIMVLGIGIWIKRRNS